MVPTVLRSSLLERAGFTHGFSLRTGGVSEGSYATLNLALKTEDDPVSLGENHRRFGEAVGFPSTELFSVRQVHGASIRRVEAGDSAEDLPEGDAVVTAVPGRPLGVRVADCLPLLLADPRTGSVAAVHCGWRGVAAGIVARALAELGRLGVATGDCLAVLGPHIRVGAFEVGEEVVTELSPVAHGCEFVHRDLGPRPHVDLACLVSAQLRNAGVVEIDDVGGCTRDERDRFFSYRRDGAHSGRHLAVVVARPPDL